LAFIYFISSRSWWETLYQYDRWKGSKPNLFVWNDKNEIAVFGASVDNTADKDLLHIDDYGEREVHSLYGHLMSSASFGGLLKRDKNQNRRPFVLTRSYFVGTQKYAAVWTGDNAATWEHLRNLVCLIMSIGLGGITWVGEDVAGFLDAYENPDNVMYER
jgi:alpha 1,3-glucosidase